MSNAEDRKHLSLLESLHSDGGEAKDEARRSRREGATDVKARRRRIPGDQGPSGTPGQAEAAETAGQMDASSADASVALAEEDYPRRQTNPMLRSSSPGTVEDVPLVELPQRQRRRPLGGILSFILCVVVPTIIAAIYYIGYASDQYVVEFRFAVRDTSTTVSTSAASANLTAMVGISTTGNPTENYMVTEYMTSRQAVDDLQAKIDIRQLYARPSIDFWSRLDASEPMERFEKYWKYMITAEFDVITGTAATQIRAFTADDAYLIAKTLLTLSEDLINEVAQRPQRDAVRYAEAEVKRAEDRLKNIRAELSAYRQKEGHIEPTTSVVLSNANLAATLKGILAQLQTDVTALQKEKLSANAPQMQYLQVRIKSTQEQLKAVEAQISTAYQGGDQSIAQVVGRYEQLDLERLFAQNMLTSTMQSLEQARSNAMTKRIYITPFVLPAMPQTSLYPRRLVAILTVAGACLLLWTIALLLSRSIREHLT